MSETGVTLFSSTPKFFNLKGQFSNIRRFNTPFADSSTAEMVGGEPRFDFSVSEEDKETGAELFGTEDFRSTMQALTDKEG